jgi:hypothetical protein
MNKDDKNRHFVLLIIDISKHGAKEMGHLKMTGPGFVNVTAWAVDFCCFGSCLFVIFFGTKPGHHAVTFTKPGPVILR